VVGVCAGQLALLLGSQRALNGDDAAVAVMALRVLDGEWPLQASVADRHGGSAVAAYLAAPLFTLLGPSEAAYKLVPLAIRMSALALVWTLVRRERGPIAALVCAVVFAASVALPKWSFYGAGGYTLCLAWLPLTLLLLRRGTDPQRRARDAVLPGWACGFGVFLLETFLAAALLCLGLLLVGPVRERRRLAWFAGGAALGLAPLYAVGSGAAELEPVALLDSIGKAPGTLLQALTHDLIALHAPANLEGMPPMRLVPNGVAVAVLVAGLLLLLLRSKPREAADGAGGDSTPRIEALLLAYLAIYLALYSLHPRAGQDARFLVPLEPALSILAGLGLHAGLAHVRGWPRAVAAATLAVALLNSALAHARLACDARIQGPRGFSHPAQADALLSHLEAQATRHLITEEWDHAWRLVFKSGRRVQACHALSALPDLLATERHDDARYAVIVSPGSRQDEAVGRRLANAGIGSQRTIVAGLAVHAFGGPAGAPAPPGWCTAPGHAEPGTR
jgi:hypothetical protein